MEKRMDRSIDRRAFIGGASLLGLGALGALAGCSSTGGAPAEGDEAADIVADSEVSCDILVIGAGFSGLAAAVEAAELGAGTLVMEAAPATGGNAFGVEYTFGCSPEMLAEGQTFNVGEIVKLEMEDSQFRGNGQVCLDMFNASGENYHWLVDHGVEYESTIPHAASGINCIHHFKGGYGSIGYIDQMTAAAQAAGVEFMFDTKAVELVKDEAGKVVGAIGEAKDGTYVQVNAKAVILATGGFAANEGYCADLGYNPAQTASLSLPSCDGSGHDIAVAAGAQSMRANAGILCDLKVPGLPSLCDGGLITPAIGFVMPMAVWVNEYAERFINEDFNAANSVATSLPCRGNRENYIIIDENMMQMYASVVGGENSPFAAYGGNFDEQLKAGLESGEIAKAASPEELAAAIGLDSAALANTIARYNEFVAQGVDADFAKAAANLMPLDPAALYAIHVGFELWTTMGSVRTDRSCRALGADRLPIEGLYAVGVEGAMIWAGVYTFSVGGACSAHNVYSGRTAAQHAVENLLA